MENSPQAKRLTGYSALEPNLQYLQGMPEPCYNAIWQFYLNKIGAGEFNKVCMFPETVWRAYYV